MALAGLTTAPCFSVPMRWAVYYFLVTATWLWRQYAVRRAERTLQVSFMLARMYLPSVNVLSIWSTWLWRVNPPILPIRFVICLSEVTIQIASLNLGVEHRRPKGDQDGAAAATR